jgi:hypothetical protein
MIETWNRNQKGALPSPSVSALTEILVEVNATQCVKDAQFVDSLYLPARRHPSGRGAGGWISAYRLSTDRITMQDHDRTTTSRRCQDIFEHAGLPDKA